jgi:hypothetical protein
VADTGEEEEGTGYFEGEGGSYELGAPKRKKKDAAEEETDYASLIQCDFCGSYVLELEKGTLQEHRRTCTKNPVNAKKHAEESKKNAKPAEEPIPEIESVSFYVCHECNGPFKTEDLLRQHYQLVHKMVPTDLSKNKTVSTNVCPWCMAPFQSAKAKKRHMSSRCVKKPGAEPPSGPNVNDNQYKCKYCSLLFPSQRSRFNHTYRAHNRYK